MTNFLENNKDVAGLFEFRFQLDSFSIDDLVSLTSALLKKEKRMDIADEALPKLRAHFSWYMRQKELTYVNGRLAEKVANDLCVSAKLRGSDTIEAVAKVPYAKRLEADPNNLTRTIATSGVARLIGRALYLNDEYRADEYLADLTRLIMKDVAQKNLSPYRQTLQTSYVNGLTGRLDTDKIRPYVLQTLKQLQRQLATAQTPHAQALKDTIDRALVIK